MKYFHKYIIDSYASVKEALVRLNDLSNDVLTLFIMDTNETMIGTLTDGDIRRGLINGVTIHDKVSDVMNKNFAFINLDKLDVYSIKAYKRKNIKLLPCLNKENKLIKVLNLFQKKSLLPIDAVVMAGGKGERLRPLTEHIPKPLLRIGEKTIIDYNIDHLLEFGIENIYVTINYLGDMIENHFSTPRGNITIKCIKEPDFLGTIGSIKCIPSFQNEVILVMNSDLFTSINYEDFYLNFIEERADMAVATIPYSVPVPYGILDLNGNRIIGVKEKPTYNYYANAGVYLIKKEILKEIPENTFYNVTDLIPKLIKQKRIVTHFPLTGYWIDIGKHDDYKKAQDLVKHIENGTE